MLGMAEGVVDRGVCAGLLERELTTPNDLPYLAPEIVLLFKSRSTRPKDTKDFTDVAALLDPTRREWLHAHIAPRYPNHPWLTALT